MSRLVADTEAMRSQAQDWLRKGHQALDTVGAIRHLAQEFPAQLYQVRRAISLAQLGPDPMYVEQLCLLESDVLQAQASVQAALAVAQGALDNWNELQKLYFDVAEVFEIFEGEIGGSFSDIVWWSAMVNVKAALHGLRTLDEWEMLGVRFAILGIGILLFRGLELAFPRLRLITRDADVETEVLVMSQGVPPGLVGRNLIDQVVKLNDGSDATVTSIKTYDRQTGQPKWVYVVRGTQDWSCRRGSTAEGHLGNVENALGMPGPIGEALQQAMEADGVGTFDDVTIMAHSQGAEAVANALARGLLPGRVKTFVSMGGPHPDVKLPAETKVIVGQRVAGSVGGGDIVPTLGITRAKDAANVSVAPLSNDGEASAPAHVYGTETTQPVQISGDPHNRGAYAVQLDQWVSTNDSPAAKGFEAEFEELAGELHEHATVTQYGSELKWPEDSGPINHERDSEITGCLADIGEESRPYASKVAETVMDHSIVPIAESLISSTVPRP